MACLETPGKCSLPAKADQGSALYGWHLRKGEWHTQCLLRHLARDVNWLYKTSTKAQIRLCALHKGGTGSAVRVWVEEGVRVGLQEEVQLHWVLKLLDLIWHWGMEGGSLVGSKDGSKRLRWVGVKSTRKMDCHSSSLLPEVTLRHWGPVNEQT